MEQQTVHTKCHHSTCLPPHCKALSRAPSLQVSGAPTSPRPPAAALIAQPTSPGDRGWSAAAAWHSHPASPRSYSCSSWLDKGAPDLTGQQRQTRQAAGKRRRRAVAGQRALGSSNESPPRQAEPASTQSRRGGGRQGAERSSPGGVLLPPADSARQGPSQAAGGDHGGGALGLPRARLSPARAD